MRAAAEVSEVKKAAEEKLSSSAAELAALQVEKEQVEAELDQNYEELEELLTELCAKPMFSMGGRRPLVNSTWIMRFTRVVGSECQGGGFGGIRGSGGRDP